MRSFLTLGVLGLAGALFAGCGGGSCDPDAIQAELSSCGADMECIQKKSEKLAECVAEKMEEAMGG